MVTEYKCKIPSQMIPAIEYGDYSGLSPQQAAIIDQKILPKLRALIESNNADYYTISYDVESVEIEPYSDIFQGLGDTGPVTEISINIIRR